MRQGAVQTDELYLAPGGSAAVAPLGAVDTLSVAVDSILRLGGVQQHLRWMMSLDNCPMTFHLVFGLHSQFILKFSRLRDKKQIRPSIHFSGEFTSELLQILTQLHLRLHFRLKTLYIMSDVG